MMTEVMRMNIQDSIERVMFLHTQLKATMDYSTLNYVEGQTGYSIQLYDNESFENVREAYEVSELAVKTNYYPDGNSLNKRFKLNGFEICVVLNEGEEGFIHEGRSNEDK